MRPFNYFVPAEAIFWFNRNSLNFSHPSARIARVPIEVLPVASGGDGAAGFLHYRRCRAAEGKELGSQLLRGDELVCGLSGCSKPVPA